MNKKLWLVILFCWQAGLLLAAPLGSQFTYQGELQDASLAANGNYDFQFEVFDAVAGGNSLATPVGQTLGVTQGIFTTQLDFGAAPFIGEAVWLEIRVRAAGGGAFTTLAPRQSITSAPYALHARFVGADAVSSAEIQDGTVTGADLAPASVGSVQINSAEVQRRITPACGAGEFIRSVAIDGTPDCAPDLGGAGYWTDVGDGRIQSSAGVRIQPDPVAAFPFTVRHDSSISSPHVVLTETGANDYARMSFYNDTNLSRYWSLAASITNSVLTDRLNIYNSGAGGGAGADIMTILGSGRVGINDTNPLSALTVHSEGAYDPSQGNGRGDFYIGNGTLGLSFGVALAGGGAGTSRIWTNTQGAMVLGNTAGDVMSIGFNGDRVGVGTNAPQHKLHVSGGSVQIDTLAHAGPGTRQVRAQPNGVLSLAASPQFYSIPATAFTPQDGVFGYSTSASSFKIDFFAAGVNHVGYAPVTLPHNAVVTVLRVYFVDNSSAENIYFNLTRASLTTSNNAQAQAEITSSGASPNVQTLQQTLPSPLTIDNQIYSYSVTAAAADWNLIQLRGMVLEYTL